MWKQRTTQTTETETETSADGFCEWIGSLPYVVERPHGLSPSVSMFDVDCRPLERSLTWLVVDHTTQTPCSPRRISVVLPRRIARAAERRRLGVCTAPMFPEYVMFSVDPLARREDVESIVLAGYGAAMS